MIIDAQLKLIFVHIPKTGGTSIHKWLEQNNSMATTLWGHQGNLDMAHLTLQQAITLMPSFPNQYFTFAFVRNPYDRIYSAFLQPYRQLYPNLDLDDFMENYVAKIDDSSDDLDPKLVHLWPMYRFLTVNGQMKADFVGRLESWSQDIAYLQQTFNIQSQPEQLNSGGIEMLHKPHNPPTRGDAYPLRDPHNSPSKYFHRFNPKQIAMINKIYQRDFEWFSYEKENMA